MAERFLIPDGTSSTDVMYVRWVRQFLYSFQEDLPVRLEDVKMKQVDQVQQAAIGIKLYCQKD